MKYKVTNKTNDTRKFRDSFLGKDVFVETGKSVFTSKPPKENSVWRVSNIGNLEKSYRQSNTENLKKSYQQSNTEKLEKDYQLRRRNKQQ